MDSAAFTQPLEQALAALAQAHGLELAHQLRSILLTNLERGRLEHVLEDDPARLPAYVGRVATSFTQLQAYLRQLQIDRDPAAWAPLYEKMQTWAYNYFLRKNFAADQTTRDLAVGCAHEAALNLLTAHFPYDTEFDAWAYVLVQNACRKAIHKALKKSVVPETQKVELTDDLGVPNELLLEAQFQLQERNDLLLAALAQLSEARRTVIQLLYIEELEPEQVAEQLGKTVGAVYSLKFNALADLRKILNQNRDNLNE